MALHTTLAIPCMRLFGGSRGPARVGGRRKGALTMGPHAAGAAQQAEVALLSRNLAELPHTCMAD